MPANWTYRFSAPILDDENTDVEGNPSASSTRNAVRKLGVNLAAALRNSTWYAKCGPTDPDDYRNELSQLVGEIENVDELEHFNLCLSALYDMGDADRCLIDLRVKK